MLGMVIYQGAGSGELERLELEDLNFQKGTIYIKGTRKSNSRTIDLKAFQLMDLQSYVMKIRPKILQETRKQTNQLFISSGTGYRLSNVINKALKELTEIEPKLKGFQQIRTTVITNWVQEYGLRKAQYLAGHKYVSSTENYKQSDQKDLLNQLDEKHPF
jgi:integrase/recombinase XerD